MGTAVIGMIASANPGHVLGLATTMKGPSIGATAFAVALGALTLATSSLADAWKLPIASDIALGLLGGLVVLWLIVTAGTTGSVATGHAWARPPAPSPDAPALRAS